MSDILVRIGIVMLVVGAALAVSRWAGRARRRLPHRVRMPGLQPGIVLFTTATCDSCPPAVERLDGVLGEAAYRRVRWEVEPDLFERYTVRRVPLTARIGRDGNGWAWEGVPPRSVLRRLSASP